MIEVEFSHREGCLEMTLLGHAGAGPKGQDPVCAAATMLVYTLAQAVRFHQEQDQLEAQPRMVLESGAAEIAARPVEDAAAEVMHTFWVVQAGFYTLAHNYPACVRLRPMQIHFQGKE